jgi:DNA-binding GntR family transcriptional regulator
VRESLAAELADEEDAALLDLSLPAPVLVIHDVAYDQLESQRLQQSTVQRQMASAT